MRTRRSPRNQDSLWRQLGTTPAAPLPLTRTAAESLELPFLSPRTKRALEREAARDALGDAVRETLAGES